MRWVVPIAALSTLAPAAAGAQLALAARAGLAVPKGEAYEDRRTGNRTSMSSLWAFEFPVQLELRYRFRPDVSVGAYASYAVASVGGDLRATCDRGGFSCSSRTVRTGIEGIYSLREFDRGFFPWLGGEIGWEWTKFDASGGGAVFEARFSGIELLGLQAGVEYRATPRFAVGPYLSASFGLYNSVEWSATGFGTGSEPVRRTLHEWISIGAAARYDP